MATREETLIVSDTGWRGRVAVLVNNVVVDILDNSPLFHGTLASDDAKIGDWWDGAKFNPSVERMVAEIDAAVIAIYSKPMTLAKEYEEREKEARDFKTAGYPLDAIPPRVAGFAVPAGMPAADAADLIIQQADTLREALASLSDLRMRKYEVIRSAVAADRFTAYVDIIAKIKDVAKRLT